MIRRRSLQFGVRTLLLTFFVLACLFGWYGHRLQRDRREWQFLKGQWRLIMDDRVPIMLYGKAVLATFTQVKVSIDVSHEPRWME